MGKVGIPRVVRDFQGRWEGRETCFWFSSLSTDRLFPQPVGRRVFVVKDIDGVTLLLRTPSPRPDSSWLVPNGNSGCSVPGLRSDGRIDRSQSQSMQNPAHSATFGRKKSPIPAQQVAHQPIPKSDSSPQPPRLTLYPYQFTVQWLKPVRHGTCVELEVQSVGVHWG